MADIAVLHWDLQNRGGAEGVCMHVLDALQHEHNITLYTVTVPDFEELNRFFGTEITDITVRIPKLAGIRFDRLKGVIESLTSEKLGYLRPLRYILFYTACRSTYRNADLIFNTHTEMTTELPTIQYIHYPSFNRSQLPDESIPDGPIFRLLDWLFNHLANLDNESIARENTLMLTNSQWTKNVIRDIYGTAPQVVYPPIDVSEFHTTPPVEEREKGFLAIGRISPGKNLLQLIDIISQLRDLDHEVHLHIIGPPFTPKYTTQVRAEAKKHDFVKYEGTVPRKELVRFLQTHRYGLHGKSNEHFGIVVAEMVTAGALPFIPKSGGQQEIVDFREELLYSDVSEAVQKIDAVLSDQALEREVRKSLPDIDKRYNAEQFRNTIRTIVNQRV